MKISGRLFFKKMKEEKTEDIMSITRKINPMVNSTLKQVFASFGKQLQEEQIIYIVPAVWGATKDGELTPLQKEINAQVAPVINKIIQALTIKDQNPAQKFAVGYIVRGWFIASLNHMIEVCRNQADDKAGSAVRNNIDLLEDVEPIGNA